MSANMMVRGWLVIDWLASIFPAIGGGPKPHPHQHPHHASVWGVESRGTVVRVPRDRDTPPPHVAV